MADTKRDENYSEAETVQRREAALKRMLATPHTAHKDQPKKRKPIRPKRARAKPRKSG